MQKNFKYASVAGSAGRVVVVLGSVEEWRAQHELARPFILLRGGGQVAREGERASSTYLLRSISIYFLINIFRAGLPPPPPPAPARDAVDAAYAAATAAAHAPRHAGHSAGCLHNQVSPYAVTGSLRARTKFWCKEEARAKRRAVGRSSALALNMSVPPISRLNIAEAQRPEMQEGTLTRCPLSKAALKGSVRPLDMLPFLLPHGLLANPRPARQATRRLDRHGVEQHSGHHCPPRLDGHAPPAVVQKEESEGLNMIRVGWVWSLDGRPTKSSCTMGGR